jgi:hypothetical protein
MGPAGAQGSGIAFEIRRVSSNTTVSLPAGNRSVIYLATTAAGNITMTLPAASSAASRFVTITRVDRGGQVTVQPIGNDLLNGVHVSIVMKGNDDSITLVSDGVEWVTLIKQ